MHSLAKRLLGSVGAVGAAMLVAGLAVGCQNKVHDENVALHKQHQEQVARNDELNRKLDQQERELAAARRSAMQQRQAGAAQPQQPPPINTRPQPETPPIAKAAPPAIAPSGDDFGPFAQREDRAAGTLTVTLPGDNLFDPGQATLKPAVKKNLDTVAASLNGKYAGKSVQIVGHTDSDPIRKSKWQSNQQLSEARAQAVRDYLLQKGVAAGRVRTLGKGAEQPEGGKSTSRRVEIVVVTGPGGAAAAAVDGGGADAEDSAAGGPDDAGSDGAQPASDRPSRPDLNK